MPTTASPLTPTTHTDIQARTSPLPGGSLINSAQGLTVLITGSGRGVGRSTAITFAQAGAKKVVITARTEEQLKEVEASIKALGLGTEVVRVRADVTDEKEVERMFVEAGEVDILINNAGYLEACVPIAESAVDEWWSTWTLNIKGTYLPTRALLKQMERNGRHKEGSRPVVVINTSSIGSVGTRPGFSGYQVTKSAINRFTEFLHYEYPNSIKTFAIHPGGIKTALAMKSMPPSTHHLLCDTPELSAGFSLWLATAKNGESDFLRGKYSAANWDVDELIGMKKEIMEKDLLWTVVKGQEPGRQD